jgi:hypothetical protein
LPGRNRGERCFEAFRFQLGHQRGVTRKLVPATRDQLGPANPLGARINGYNPAPRAKCLGCPSKMRKRRAPWQPRSPPGRRRQRRVARARRTITTPRTRCFPLWPCGMPLASAMRRGASAGKRASGDAPRAVLGAAVVTRVAQAQVSAGLGPLAALELNWRPWSRSLAQDTASYRGIRACKESPSDCVHPVGGKRDEAGGVFGGEGGIRTLSGALESVTYRNHIAAIESYRLCRRLVAVTQAMSACA